MHNNIFLTVIFIFSVAVSFGQPLNSPESLKAYLDKQPANSPDKPIKITMNVNEQMLRKIATTISSTNKYVFLDLSASNITYIGWGAFEGCTYLTNITIPNSVTKIDTVAFVNCTSLASITIPNNVFNIGFGAFSGCTSLTTLTVNSGNSTFISDDGVLYNKSKSTLVLYPGGKTGAFTIPNTVTNIEKGAFSSCASLTSVTIPNSVTTIGGGAFGDCSSLISVTIPNNITSIGVWAFYRCTSLTSVTFQGTISSSNFDFGAFDETGDLRAKYLAGGPGTYTRARDSNTWTKQ